MRLKLTITNSDLASGVRKEVIFEHQGGVIGRKKGNDWVLPDAKRFISSKHAQIKFENNVFLLGDLSTNGIFLNNGASPIGHGNFVSISSGDQFKIGDYNILVTIEAVSASVPDVHSGPETSSASSINIFPEDMDPLELLGSATSEPISPAGAVSKQSSLDDAPAGQDFFQPSQFKSAVDEAYAIPTNWAELPDVGQSSAVDPKGQPQGVSDRRVVSEEKSAANISPNLDRRNRAVIEQSKISQELGATPGVTSSDDGQLSDKAIKSFLKGVGIPLEALDQSDISNIMFDFGRVLRTTVQGLMDILSARAKLKSEFRMNYTTIREKENNPLKFSMSLDDALSNLFLKKGDDYLVPNDAVEEAIQNMKDHQIALLAGMQAALRDLVQEFDPEIIEENIEKYMEVSSKIPVYRKAKSWDLYRQSYNEFKLGMGDNFQELFGRAFTEAYEKQMSELSNRRLKR